MGVVKEQEQAANTTIPDKDKRLLQIFINTDFVGYAGTGLAGNERGLRGNCQNDRDHAARWHREFHQELYKSGGMISFLSFLFFCKLKKDKIGHTI